MKISNSKKQLARAINGSGGWRGGAQFAAQSGLLGYVEFYASKPVRESVYWRAKEGVAYRFLSHTLLPNWHQTILSRDEYIHLYPVSETEPEPVKVVVENKTTCRLTVSDKPTIEQLAADYRNRKDYAYRKQQEADAAKADAEAKLAELVAAGTALGLVLGVAGAEPELVITDWRDLRVGDIIEYVDGDIKDKIGMSGPVVEFHPNAMDGMHVRLECDNGPNKGRLGWPRRWRFIRRPAKGGANA